ncbi:MAG: hypothetical protein PHI48_05135 [Bacteroidales bacterium]|nr:hypothetical protein [Bacteroidales bacterium]
MRNLEGVEERSDVEKLTDFYDLINNTPFIESFVYDNLPVRLDRAIRHCKNKRLSDVMLLSTMVALSACLPKVTVKRHGLITLRLAMNLAALRKAEDKKTVDHYLLRDGL